MRPQRRWTAADDDRLRELIGAGASHSTAARLMGRSPGSVSARLHTLARDGMAVSGSGRASVRVDLDPIDERVERLCGRYGWRGLELLP